MASETRQRRSSARLGALRRSSQEIWNGISRRLIHTDAGAWQCEHCTFKNKKAEFLSCEMCGMIRSLPQSTNTNDANTGTYSMTITSFRSHEKTEKTCASEDMDERFLQASSEQEDHRQKTLQDREDEDYMAIVQDRMQEIVDRQRVLYDEIVQKRVRRQSIPFHLETQKSIENLQELLRNELNEQPPTITPKASPERPTQRPSSTGPLHSSSEKAAATMASSSTSAPSVSLPNYENDSSSNSSSFFRSSTYRASRRAARRARRCQNPASSMSNPWEERTMGVSDLLSVQEELWERVNGSGEQKPSRRRTGRGSKAK